MRSLILPLVLLGACMHPTSTNVAEESVPAPEGRVLFYTSNDLVFPIACYRPETAVFGGCMDLVRTGMRFGVLARDGSPEDIALGARVRQVSCEKCYADDGFDVDPDAMPQAHSGYGVYPLGIDLDVRAVARMGDEDVVASPFARRALPGLARAFWARTDSALGTTRIAPAEDVVVPITQRADVDMNGDGVEDHLYVAQLDPCHRCDRGSWSALVLEVGGEVPRLIVLREGEDATCFLDATLELDGHAPREIVYNWTDETDNGRYATYGSVARIEDDRLVEIGPSQVDCPPR